MAKSDYGKGWVIYEERFNPPQKNLISIRSPRISKKQAAIDLEQLYIDRYASIKDKLAYKKSRSFAAYKAIEDIVETIHCGIDPVLVCIRSYKIVLCDKQMKFYYRVAVNGHPSKEMHQTICV